MSAVLVVPGVCPLPPMSCHTSTRNNSAVSIWHLSKNNKSNIAVCYCFLLMRTRWKWLRNKESKTATWSLSTVKLFPPRDGLIARGHHSKLWFFLYCFCLLRTWSLLSRCLPFVSVSRDMSLSCHLGIAWNIYIVMLPTISRLLQVSTNYSWRENHVSGCPECFKTRCSFRYEFAANTLCSQHAFRKDWKGHLSCRHFDFMLPSFIHKRRSLYPWRRLLC